jgi:hypothetical protein
MPKIEYRCENCERIYDPDEDIGEKITDKNWHMEPGAVVPYGVCDCGGYIHKMRVGKPVSYAKEEKTNAVIQSQSSSHFLEGLLKLLSEEQRQELDVTGCISVGFGRQHDRTERFIDRQLKEMREFPAVMRTLEADFAASLKAMPKDSPNMQTIPPFEPNFTITKEQLEMAAKAAPSLTELLEKQISQTALEEYAKVVNGLISQQRREWKTKTFAERYGNWSFAEKKMS